MDANEYILNDFQNKYGDYLKKEDIEIIPIPSGQPYFYEYDLKCEECEHQFFRKSSNHLISPFQCPDCKSSKCIILHLKIYTPAPKYGLDNKYPPKNE